jgi:hypothetical protein
MKQDSMGKRAARVAVLLSLGACGAAIPLGPAAASVAQASQHSLRRDVLGGYAHGVRVIAAALASSARALGLAKRGESADSLLHHLVRKSSGGSTFSPGVIAACVIFPTLILLGPLLVCFFCGCCSCWSRRDQAGRALARSGVSDDDEDNKSVLSRRSKVDCRLSEVGPVRPDGHEKRSSVAEDDARFAAKGVDVAASNRV